MKVLLRNHIFLFSVAFAALCFAPSRSFGQVAISIRIGPPALPVYTQPPCPVEGYIWTPGYWAWGPGGYYWVPGVWVAPPRPGLLWTPGYWGFADGLYAWHAGYWGPHVGFYGGIDYGFGYPGNGFVGGRWEGGRFAYNTAVVNVNRTVVRNVYVDRTGVRQTTVNRASFNGRGGVTARPTAQDQRWAHEQHVQPTANQVSHEQSFRDNHNAQASVNHGRPQTVSMTRVNGERFNEAGRETRGENQPNHAQPPAPPKNNVRRERHFETPERQNESRPNQMRPSESRPQQARPEQPRPQQERPNESRPPQGRQQQARAHETHASGGGHADHEEHGGGHSGQDENPKH